MTTSLEQIIQFLNNLSYCTYVGIQDCEKNRAYVILLYIRRNSVLAKIVRMLRREQQGVLKYGVGNQKNQ